MPLMLRRISPCPSPGWEGATSAPAGWAQPCLSVSVLQPRGGAAPTTLASPAPLVPAGREGPP